MTRSNAFWTLCCWLTGTALVDWLVGRTLTRAAIFMPKAPPMIVLYQAFAWIGQLAFTLTGILALVTLGALIWRMRRWMYGALSLVLGGLLLASLVFVVIPPVGWMSVGYHVLTLAAIALMGMHARKSSNLRLFVVPALAVGCGELYALSAALNNTLQFEGSGELTLALYNLGEALVAASGFALWWAYARGRADRRIWLLALVPALAFSIGYLANPSLTGVTAMWSTHLSLWLPWLLYALSIWCATSVVLVSWRGDRQIALAMALFAAGGYAPQLSTHAFLGLIALWLLADYPARASDALVRDSKPSGLEPSPRRFENQSARL